MNEIIISILSLVIFISIMSIRIGRKRKVQYRIGGAYQPNVDNTKFPPPGNESVTSEYSKSMIMDDIEDMQEKAWENNKGHNEYELEVRERVSNYIIEEYRVNSSKSASKAGESLAKILSESCNSDINSQIRYIELLRDNMFAAPVFISIIQSLKELRSIKKPN